MAKAKVVWRERALADINRLYDFLIAKNPEAAASAARLIAQAADMLEANPRIGRPMADGTHRRELFIPFGAKFYVIRYFVVKDTILIVRVWHSRENRTNSS